MGSINILEWIQEGEPKDVAFRFHREFEMDDLRRHDTEEYVKSSMLAMAKTYAKDNDFRFLPVCIEEWTALLPNSSMLLSEKGEILIDMVFDGPHDEGRLWAAVMMKTF